jgi:short-subunit dehydrogenase
MRKKTIFISGGTDGLGKALAQHFVKKHHIIILGPDATQTSQVARQIGCDYIVADIRDTQLLTIGVRSMIKKYKRIDCLINNAGVWIEGPFAENDPEKIREVIEVNTLGTILLSHLVVPQMQKQKKGRIINVVSQAGIQIKQQRAVYQASKWAITGFTKSLALELGSVGISVCGFYPGAMKTNFFKKFGIKKDMSKHLKISEAVRCVEFMVESPNETLIPEFGVRLLDS